MKQSILILSIVFCLASCEKYDEVHKQYVNTMDEQTYSAIPENVVLHSGDERIVVSANIIYTASLDKFIIEVENETHEYDIPRPHKDTIRIMQELGALEEGVVDMKVYTTDNQGNKSIVKLYTGKVYGSKYKAELLNRNILETENSDAGFVFHFNSPPEKSVRLDFTYTKTDEGDTTISVPSALSTLVIDGYKLGSPYSYVTYYLPDRNSIDILATADSIKGEFPAIVESEVEIERSGWEVVEVSTEQPGHPATNLFDGNLSTFWHNSWDVADAPEPLPHTMLVDMTALHRLSKLELHRRQGNSATKAILIEAGSDNVNWQTLGTAEWAEGDGDKAQIITVENPVETQYLKISVIASNDASWMAVAELFAWELIAEK